MKATEIFIVTPSFNSAETIDQTVTSVVSQAGPFEIHYHVQDGGSNDATLRILRNWQDRLARGDVPLFCKGVHFSFESIADKGMYDAIARGFQRFQMAPDAWMTWINADDMLAPAACALMSSIDRDARGSLVSWVSGAATIIRDGAIVSQADRRFASEVIRRGLCDGQHWEFVQQEGCFFRNQLWRTLNVEADFAALRLAGDWNLWRRLAESADLYQVDYPLGLFHQRAGQLSQVEREAYFEELDSIVSWEDRTDGLIALAGEEVKQKRLAVSFQGGSLKFVERPLDMHLLYRLQQRFGEARAAQILSEAEAAKAGDASYVVAEYVAADPSHAPRTDIVAHNGDWQFPAITEAHAFARAQELLPYVPGVCYLAFPWATLIDQANSAFDRGAALRQALRKLDMPRRGYERVVTVCQHIHMERYADYLTEAGVTDVFWTHAQKDESVITAPDGRSLRVHPFPLYPVQAVPIDRSMLDGERPHLFSFVGAKYNKWYLSRSREWILDELGEHPRGVVGGRDSWHYQKVVYDLQIRKTAASAASLVDDAASSQFRELLLSSVFSLCPSGSGPNSIRLWEAIGAGSIPVILADTYKAPGDEALWENAVLTCPETQEDIRALPERLEAIAADPPLLTNMRRHLDQVWMLYGPDTFIYDIQKLYLKISGEAHAARGAPPPLVSLARRINNGSLAGKAALDRFLTLCEARLSVASEEFCQQVRQERALRRACEYALAASADDQLVERLRAAWAGAGLPDIQDGAPVAARPVPVRRPRIHLFGRHGHRTPMAYGPYRRLFASEVDFVDDIWQADIVVTGFDIDLRTSAEALSAKLKVRPEMQFQVMSEEPLWDTVWSSVMTGHTGSAGPVDLPVSYAVANHLNSSIFEFERLPYFITTDDKFFLRYANQFRRNAKMSASDILASWRRAPLRAAFYAEKRIDERYDVNRPDLGLRGLCAYRSRVAERVGRGEIERVGHGWSAASVRRQALADWHLDKLATLDGKAMIVSGLENTHLRDYITEKIFDAFAVLAVPIYFAGPDHRVHELCPQGGFLNLWGRDEDEAARLIDEFEPDIAFAEAYLATQRALARLFADPETLNRERARVAAGVLMALQAPYTIDATARS